MDALEARRPTRTGQDCETGGLPRSKVVVDQIQMDTAKAAPTNREFHIDGSACHRFLLARTAADR